MAALAALADLGALAGWQPWLTDSPGWLATLAGTGFVDDVRETRRTLFLQILKYLADWGHLAE